MNRPSSHKTDWLPYTVPRPIDYWIRLAIILGATGILHKHPCSIANESNSVESAAANPAAYQPAGAPADPKVQARWNFYRDYAQTTELLKQITAAHPDLCRLESLGKSHGNREMWILTITNFKTLRAPDYPFQESNGPDTSPADSAVDMPSSDIDKELTRPAYWIDGGIHANEIQGVDTSLYTAWFLTEMFNRNATITRLLNERIFYLLPMMSPDSRDAHMYRPNSTNSPRSGQWPVDDDLDGLVDEDGPDDLDGDGHITQMRIRDPNGRMKSHDVYPDMMVPCNPDETGHYTLLGTEGIDNDGDGLVNEDGDGIYDPNRDWAWQWQPRYVEDGAYKYPFSVPENRMVADFIMAHPNIAGAQSYHNTGGMILRGPGVLSEKWPAADTEVFDQIGKQGELMLPGYRYIGSMSNLYEVHGAEDDWFFVMQGVFAFTNELHTPFNLFKQESKHGGYFGKQEDLRKFDEYLLFGDGYISWHAMNHPQYGKIEIGGQKKNWNRQPPSFMLEEECHRNMAFTLFHADQMPQVSIDSIQVRNSGNGPIEVTAAIINRKRIPTHSELDIQQRITPPDRASLAGKNVKIITALSADDMFFKEATSQHRASHEVRLRNVPSMKPVYVRWLVHGPGPYTVSIRSVKGGVARKVWAGDSGD
ncbi:MAG: hypothetical protein JW829_06515 [Pirellulales bacterium]|nr:hypothetical protein [Pirellulales bacterium]